MSCAKGWTKLYDKKVEVCSSDTLRLRSRCLGRKNKIKSEAANRVDNNVFENGKDEGRRALSKCIHYRQARVLCF